MGRGRARSPARRRAPRSRRGSRVAYRRRRWPGWPPRPPARSAGRMEWLLGKGRLGPRRRAPAATVTASVRGVLAGATDLVEAGALLVRHLADGERPGVD